MSLWIDKDEANDYVHKVNDYEQLQLYISVIHIWQIIR